MLVEESYVSPLYNYELIYNRLMELRTRISDMTT